MTPDSRFEALAAIVKVIDERVRVEVEAALDDVYNRVQSLGARGLHADAEINRQDALDQVRAVKKERSNSATGT